ncbi:hypothetical protein NE857_21925 [Nocardiopsis exhalans]|uniref:Uncharacterized protein n=1 Tax=Nocardiopsis exhalans TaxID=163604 RepID=A0ABY5D1U6_9ACTN|nr:hypothetical protein [Nocardiopsis exhalans]USY17977.1 hypothetical protein NE857_21925 [Nocardiopsis exhalans]
MTPWIDFAQTALPVALAPAAALAGVWVAQRGALKLEKARAERERQAQLATERRAAYAEFLGLAQRVSLPGADTPDVVEFGVARARISIVGSEAAARVAEELVEHVRALALVPEKRTRQREQAWARASDAVKEFARVCREENQADGATRSHLQAGARKRIGS